jgi:hypothetical protein
MTGRMWFGPGGVELIGMTPDGTPIAANEDGVGEMVEAKGVTFDGLTSIEEGRRAAGLDEDTG